jgi:hypothetical protein
MVNVYTVLNTSFNHTKEYVYRLKRSIEKNTTVKFNFFCLTNVELPGIQTIPTDELTGWAKLDLCRPSIKGRIYYMDLDTVLTGNIDFFFNTQRSFFCKNWLGSRRTNVMSLDEDERALIWDFWTFSRMKIIPNFQREGAVYDFVSSVSIPVIQDIHPGKVVSLQEVETCIPIGCKMVTFSNGKYPKNLEDENYIKKYW